MIMGMMMKFDKHVIRHKIQTVMEERQWTLAETAMHMSLGIKVLMRVLNVDDHAIHRAETVKLVMDFIARFYDEDDQ